MPSQSTSLVATWRYQFTVLTPTYNRAYTLARVYESLRNQSFQDFEWIVVDDGSTDGTKEQVEQWQQEAAFPIHYFWQTNQHKKTAINHGVLKAKGELLVILDSDDQLQFNALTDMARTWREIPDRDRSHYAAVTGLCKAPSGRIVGDMYPYDLFDANPLDLQYKFNIRGEKFGCLSTEVVRRFPFPEDIVGFVPESLVWRAMARAGYKTRFVNQVYRVYHESQDSLSKQGKDRVGQYALGLWLLAQDTLVECQPWFHYRRREFFKSAVRYTRFALHLRAQSIPKPSGYPLRGAMALAMVWSMAPLGAMLFMRDKIRARMVS